MVRVREALSLETCPFEFVTWTAVNLIFSGGVSQRFVVTPSSPA